MKKLALAATIFCGAVFMFTGCHLGVHGSGLRKTEKRDVPAFTAINTSGMLEIDVKCQQAVSLEVEADDNLLSLVQTEVVDGVLRIKTTRNYRSQGGIIVRVTVPNLYADLSQLLPDDVASQLDALYKNPQASTEAKMQALLEAGKADEAAGYLRDGLAQWQAALKDQSHPKR